MKIRIQTSEEIKNKISKKRIFCSISCDETQEYFKYFIEINDVLKIERNNKNLIEISIKDKNETIELNSFFDFSNITIEY